MMDLRDLSKELEDLRERKSDLAESLKDDAVRSDGDDRLDDDDEDRLAMLESLEKDLGNDLDAYARNESAMIADDSFEAYAEELADDLGAIDRNATWPLNHIDWQAAARDLQQDYTLVTFDGEDWWIRSY
jgi:hypothetical protein